MALELTAWRRSMAGGRLRLREGVVKPGAATQLVVMTPQQREAVLGEAVLAPRIGLKREHSAKAKDR